MKLVVGQKMPDFSYNTVYNNNLSYLEDIKGKKTVLLFLRYLGCSMCQLDLLDLEVAMDEFKANNIDVKVVLQSSQSIMLDSFKESPLSYDIICDPNQELYKQFQISPAKNKLQLAGGGVIKKVLRAKKEGIQHGEYEGNELQLPALFIMNEDSVITYAHYGTNGADIPSAKEIISIININK